MSELEKTMAENPVENSEVETEATATVEEPAVAAPTEEIAAETTEAGREHGPQLCRRVREDPCQDQERSDPYRICCADR